MNVERNSKILAKCDFCREDKFRWLYVWFERNVKDSVPGLLRFGYEKISRLKV